MFSDSIGVTYLYTNLAFHSRMKHLVIDYHFIRGIVVQDELKVSHIPSRHQLTYLLIKPISRSQHEFFLSKIDALDHSSILHGRISTIIYGRISTIIYIQLFDPCLRSSIIVIITTRKYWITAI